MTSRPESRLSRGRVSLQFEGHDDGQRGSDPKFGQNLSFQVKFHSFAEVPRDLIKCLALGYVRNFHAFCDVTRLLPPVESWL
jgi:hypothetical protein